LPAGKTKVDGNSDVACGECGRQFSFLFLK
jgi:hypothetical protein